MAKKLLLEWPEYDYVAGLDEVGRGCGAGPVVTAAVILPRGFNDPLIRDSKKLSEKQRVEAYQLIKDNALAITCHAGSASEIDKVGINKATFNTMHKCIDDLTIKPQYLLVDGIVWEDYLGTNADNSKLTLVPKGDDTYTCIAAAAIVAKVRRDEYMAKLHELHPQYNWVKNKGYLTPDHIKSIKEHGPNRYHRSLYIRKFTQQNLDL
jgi:ribonuclease HII